MDSSPGATSASAASNDRLAEVQLARLATFPEDNPNLVIETNLQGEVSYANPVAQARFPDLVSLGTAHPLLKPLPEIVPLLMGDDRRFRSCEVVVGASVFETKICVAEIAGQRLIRLYASDVTAMRNAERTVHELAARVVRAQEEERRRISRELHDEAGQALTALKIGLSLIQVEDTLEPAALRENLDEAIRLVEDTHERIRTLAHGLRPAALDAVGLNATLDDLCREFAERTGLTILFDGRELPVLDDDIQICAYRLVQEALTNCGRHADAATVRVRLAVDAAADTLTLSVHDDGQGADLALLESARGSSFGLIGMQERIELLAGQFSLESQVGLGFGIVASIPLRPILSGNP